MSYHEANTMLNLQVVAARDAAKESVRIAAEKDGVVLAEADLAVPAPEAPAPLPGPAVAGWLPQPLGLNLNPILARPRVQNAINHVRRGDPPPIIAPLPNPGAGLVPQVPIRPAPIRPAQVARGAIMFSLVSVIVGLRLIWQSQMLNETPRNVDNSRRDRGKHKAQKLNALPIKVTAP